MLPSIDNKFFFKEKGVAVIPLILGIVVIAVIGIFVTLNLNSKKEIKPTTVVNEKPLMQITTLLVKATPSELQARLAKKLGLDKKNGINIETIDSYPGDAERDFFAGKYKIIYGGTLSTFSINLKGVELRIIAPAIDQPYDVIVPTDSPIKTLADLKGKKFATLPKITASYMSTATVLRSAGIDSEKDMKITYGTPDQIIALLSKGEVDAGIAVAPLSYSLLSSGKFRVLADLEQVWEESQGGIHMPFVSFAVHEDWYQTNKEETKALISTYYEAARMIQADPTIIKREIPEYLAEYHLDDPKSLELVETRYPKLLYTKADDKGFEAIRRTYEKAKEYGIIPNNVPPYEQIVKTKQESGL